MVLGSQEIRMSFKKLEHYAARDAAPTFRSFQTLKWLGLSRFLRPS